MCQEPLPTDILACVSALGATVAQWAHEHGGATLAEQEAAVQAAVRAALPALLGAMRRLTTPDLDPALSAVQRRCPGCDHLVRMQSVRPRTLLTSCGAVTYRRSYYPCPRCHTGFCPADAVLGVTPNRHVSATLDAWLVSLGTSTTFDEAVALLAQLTGLSVGAETVRQQCLVAGAALRAAEDAAVVQVQATQEAAEPVDAAPGALVVEADGAMIAYLDGWHEVKVGAVGGTTTADGHLTALSYIAVRAGPDRFGPRLLTEAARRGALDVVGWDGGLRGTSLALLRPVHLLGDGAPWIWHLAAEHFGDRTEAVDFYHAVQHLATVAGACFGEGTPEAAAWLQTQRHLLHQDGVAPVRAALGALTAPTLATRDVLRRERGYFATNAARMDYPALRARGLPIGSGAIESAAKHVVQHRMKRPGQRWSDHGGDAMLALRARRASRRPLA